ncbi:MAG TPA: universal stress protein [Blastocatellia bacterium]
MLPFKRILWPTDFSEPSYLALSAAIELATQFGSELLIVHVAAPVPRPGWALQFYPDPDVYEVELHDYEKALMDASRRKLDDSIASRVPKLVPIRPILTSGEAPSEIVRISREEKADLIVIATHGLSGWRHLVHGSVTEKVLRMADCPVLTIRSAEGAVKKAD